MTGRDLVMARGKLAGTGRGSVKAMADKLETPYRTYQGWEAHRGLTPGVASVAVKSLLTLAERDTEAAELAAADELSMF